MKITLYEHEFNITESNICEARAKYLISSALGNSVGLIKRESLKCEFVDKMLSHTPKIAGALLLNMTKHLLYVLQQEGVTMNAQDYLSTTFAYYDSALQNICKNLKNNPNVTKNIAVNELTKATMLDLFELWRGYSQAHGFDAKNEFYTVEKLHKAKESVGKFYSTFEKKSTDAKKNAEDMLQNSILNYLHKNVVQKENTVPVQTFVQALYDAPYIDWLYKATRLWLGESVGLEKYHNYFRSNFKSGTYHDINADPPKAQLSSIPEAKSTSQTPKQTNFSVESKLADVMQKLKILQSKPQFNIRGLYYYCDEQEKSKEKFAKALASYVHLKNGEIKGEYPLICYDDTMFGSAEDGFTVTTTGIYWHNLGDDGEFLVEFPDLDLKHIKKNLYFNDMKISTAGLNEKEVENLHELIDRLRNMFANNNSPTPNNVPQENNSAISDDELVLRIKEILPTWRNAKRFNFKSHIYYYGDTGKSEQKFQNALKSYVHLKNGEVPLICYDSTTFGSADEGLTMTTEGIHICKDSGSTPIFISHNKLSKIELRGFLSKDLYVNDIKIDKSGLSSSQLSAFCEILQRLHERIADLITEFNQ